MTKKKAKKKTVRKNAVRKSKASAAPKWLKLPAGAKSVRIRRVGGQLIVEARRK